MATPQPDQIDLVAVMLLDVRATSDAQKRCIASAQASAEEYRVGRDPRSLDDIGDALAKAAEHTRVLAEGLTEVRKVLRGVGSGVAET